MKPIVFLYFFLSALFLNARDIVPFEIDSQNNLPTVEVIDWICPAQTLSHNMELRLYDDNISLGAIVIVI